MLHLPNKTKDFTLYGMFYIYLQLESDKFEFTMKEHALVKGAQGLGHWK